MALRDAGERIAWGTLAAGRTYLRWEKFAGRTRRSAKRRYAYFLAYRCAAVVGPTSFPSLFVMNAYPK